VALTGLSLNPTLKYAYLVPRTTNVGGQWVVETHLEPSYVGLVKLVTDTGSAKNIYAHPVYEGDEFNISLGTSQEITHSPKYKSKDITHVYCVAVLADGSKMIEVMTKDEVDNIQERSESFKAYKAGTIKSCVWTSDYTEMARKTVIRRAVKYLPKTNIWDKLSTAISLDEGDYKATDVQIDYIEQLLTKAAIPQQNKDAIEMELNTMSAERAKEVIEELKEAQTNPIYSGDNYSQTDIKETIKTDID
jgi:recombination protein RecT